MDYVIFHELCHLKEHNHSARFYELLVGLLPDWKERKAELDELAEHLPATQQITTRQSYELTWSLLYCRFSLT